MDVFAIIYINTAIEKSIHFSFTLDFFVIIKLFILAPLFSLCYFSYAKNSTLKTVYLSFIYPHVTHIFRILLHLVL